MTSRKTAFALLAGCTLWASGANADDGGRLHADIGLQAGVMRRVLTGKPDGGADANFGPSAQIQGHIALLPMLRAGLYVAGDISPQSGTPARHFLSGGLHFKVTPPFMRTDRLSTWFVLGLGYSLVYAPSFHLPSTDATGASFDTAFDGSPGHFVEIPLGVGFGWRLRKPWQLYTELGARIGFAHGGQLYDEGRVGHAPAQAPAYVTRGNDTLALSLSIGIALDL